MKFILTLFFSLDLLLSNPLAVIASDWYVSPTGSGAGTINSPGSLTNAVYHLSWGTNVAAGDTVWLRGGSGSGYTCGPMLLDTNTHGYTYGWQMGFAGANGSPVTWRSYSNEWAIIGGNWSFGDNGYHRFRDLEFFDPYKGSNPTNLPDSPRGPWTIFGVHTAWGNELINCVVHDCGIGTGGMPEVRGCIFYYVGMSGLEHLVYGGVAHLEGCIAFWTSQNNVNFGAASDSNLTFICESNIMAGTGEALINRHDGGGNISLANSQPYIHTNLIRFNYCYSVSNFTDFGTDVANSGDSTGTNLAAIVYGNVFANYSPVIFGYDMIGTDAFTNNTVHVSTTDFSYNFLRRTNYGSWYVDYNHYTAPNAAVHFYDQGSVYTYGGWTNATGFDLHSTTNGVRPSDAVYVLPNVDQVKRANIAVYNWSMSDNVSVNVSSILSVGDNYMLKSAQDYNGAAVQMGTYSGSSIIVPMTNLAVSAYICAPGWMTNPPSMSPEFGAFVLTGSTPSGTATANNVSVTGSVIISQ